MKLHALLITLEDHPANDGAHTRRDTLENDIITALSQLGYEEVTVVSHDVH